MTTGSPASLTAQSPNTTLFNTVIAGVLIFVVGQIIQRFVLEPIQEYKKTVGKIDYFLTFYANSFNTDLITHLKNKHLEHAIASIIIQRDTHNFERISQDIRSVACELTTNYAAIPRRWGISWLLVKLGIIRTQMQINVAQGKLIYISNSIFSPPDNHGLKNHEACAEIRKSLGLQ